ncbi:MAG: hypothetical protein R3E31_29400 [Chloroflexota bacterium]
MTGRKRPFPHTVPEIISEAATASPTPIPATETAVAPTSTPLPQTHQHQPQPPHRPHTPGSNRQRRRWPSPSPASSPTPIPSSHLGVAAPVVILEDQAGFVDRDENYIMPVASQALGQITRFLHLPLYLQPGAAIGPQGAWRDVDNDEDSETGVQVFAIAYWTNTFGDPFLKNATWAAAAGQQPMPPQPAMTRRKSVKSAAAGCWSMPRTTNKVFPVTLAKMAAFQ